MVVNEPVFDVCSRCQCCDREWESCWYCFGEGGWSLYELSPIEYGPDDYQTCYECHGEGTLPYCSGGCDRDGKHVGAERREA